MFLDLASGATFQALFEVCSHSGEEKMLACHYKAVLQARRSFFLLRISRTLHLAHVPLLHLHESADGGENT